MAHPGSAGRNSQHNPYLTPTTEEGSQLEKTQTQRSSTHEPDYFGQVTSATNGNSNGNGKPAAAAEGSTETKEETVSSPTEADTPAKKGKGMFGKKFNMSFNMKKFSTGTAMAEPAKPAAVDEKAEDSDSRSTKTDEKTIEDNFYGSLQRIRQGYEEQLAAGATKLETQIAPSLPSDTPVLKPPSNTTILIQEDRPEAGGVADLFEGTVSSLGQQADLIEKTAPTWLAEVLLRVRLHLSFPYNQDPSLSAC
jgi:WD repeat-containing protein 48